MSVLISYVDEAYRIIHGAFPEKSLHPRERIAGVMGSWDGRLFDGDPQRELVGKLALCQIGKCWFEIGVPYDLELIVERLRELMPELGTEPVTYATFRDVLCGSHPSQYATPRRV